MRFKSRLMMALAVGVLTGAVCFLGISSELRDGRQLARLAHTHDALTTRR